MKLLSYNIQYGFGADGHYDLTRAAKVIDGADIIALQEVERHWSRSNQDDQPALLEALLPHHYTAYGPAFDMDASTHDGTRVINRRRQFGTMILSRWPILWTRLHLLPMRRMITPRAVYPPRPCGHRRAPDPDRPPARPACRNRRHWRPMERHRR